MSIRCAIYTRKSTEEGLEQDFNSLDAQREACEAYVQSQKGLGWKVVNKRYDDGGISGGTMERPALQALLDDIGKGRVDLVIVYKVDRLTRSLMDFAKIIETFDAREVSFVSVTQQFNTSNSMGRLTLNVLLSFAQFEREVTAERIRDKIAASKKKGMWMGGLAPLGYDAVDKKLVINEEEAETVKTLFELYLELGSVSILKEKADELDLRTKARKPNNGSRRGSAPFTRGHLYKLLKNPIYIGQLAHKGVLYPGEHKPIVDKKTWDKALSILRENAVIRKYQKNAQSPSLLAGLIKDENETPLSPSHTNKGDKRYRYYVSTFHEGVIEDDATGWRLPAKEIEDLVIAEVASFLRDKVRLVHFLSLESLSIKALLSEASRLADRLERMDMAPRREILVRIVNKVVIHKICVQIILHTDEVQQMIHRGEFKEHSLQKTEAVTLDIPVQFKRRGVETKVVIAGSQEMNRLPDSNLVSLIAQAHVWLKELSSGETLSRAEIAERYGVDQGDVSKQITLSFLAPGIVEAILDGTQPIDLMVSRLKRMRELPLSWAEQRAVLGFV